MKKVLLNEEMYYTPNFDYDQLKNRRKKFATNRINWFMNNSSSRLHFPSKEFKSVERRFSNNFRIGSSALFS